MTQRILLSHIYLLVGSEEWLRQESVQQIEAAAGVAPIDRCRLEAGQTPLTEALDQARLVPFQSRHRLIILDDVQKLSTGEQELLVAYCRRPATTGLLVLIVPSETAPHWLRPMLANVTQIACHPLAPPRLPAWLQDRASQRLGKTLDRAAAVALVDRIGPALRPLAQALEQMACYVGSRTLIVIGDVMRLVGVSVSEETFAMTRALGRGDLAGALERLNRLLDQGDAPEVVIGLLRWHWEKLHRDRRGFRILLAADLAMKRGRVAPRLMMEALVIRLARLAAAPRAPAAVS